MIFLIKLFLNSKLDLIQTVKFFKQLFRIQIQKGGKVLLWNQVKSRIEACYSELVLGRYSKIMGTYFQDESKRLIQIKHCNVRHSRQRFDLIDGNLILKRGLVVAEGKRNNLLLNEIIDIGAGIKNMGIWVKLIL